MLVRAVGRAGELQATADRLGVTPTVADALADPARASAGDPGCRRGDLHAAPGRRPTPLRGAGPKTVVLDVVYAPWPTPFATTAAAAGARVCSGLEVLLQQAVAQVELMTGRPGPVAEMRTALEAAVAARV